MNIKYECEICHSIFSDKQQCMEHEITHVLPNSKEKWILIGRQLNKPELVCEHCEYSYYVYGCEFDCQYYFKKCNARLNWPYWKPATQEKI